jgi:predicted nucleotidyltransferase
MVGFTQSGDQIVREFTRRLHESLGVAVRGVHWFGSRVRGQGSADSDYDLLVETVETLTPSQRDRIVDITMDISAAHNCTLDVHYYTTAELHSSPYAHTPFVQRVLEEALVL